VRSAELLADKVERPLGFELSRAWQEIAERVDELRAPTQVSVLVLPGAVAAVRWALEGQPVEQGDIGHDGRVALTVRGYRAERVAALLAGFGRWVEVVAPPEGRSYLAGVGRELVEMYGDDPA